ncbi:SGNH/GDSL hydrolase family protein [Actinoplanes xinjiangensis]|uniref:SGNH/GDSL hydrolase family protein n=1 Tax=Actinoplanes xinjiangensis TaxID=512350 RepID=UPI001EF39B69|nr:SGNH/GDSL hydrolase family protein [Actinoplanes xinjiangensis]
MKLLQKSCSGATTSDVVEKQLGDLSDRTNLVTITAGANDLDLVAVLTVCADPGQAEACGAKLLKTEAVLTTELPGRLAKLLTSVKAAAPKARIAITGYPVPFEDVAECAGLPKSLRDNGVRAVTGLNRVLSVAAASTGVTFVDVAERFAGHGLCSTSPWLVGIEGIQNRTVLHPNRDGQVDGYLPTLKAAIGRVESAWSAVPASPPARFSRPAPPPVPFASAPDQASPVQGDEPK